MLCRPGRRTIDLLADKLARCAGGDDFSGLGVEFLKLCTGQMSTGILENQVKVRMFINVIEKGKGRTENKNANGGNKTKPGNQESFAS